MVLIIPLIRTMVVALLMGMLGLREEGYIEMTLMTLELRHLNLMGAKT